MGTLVRRHRLVGIIVWLAVLSFMVTWAAIMPVDRVAAAADGAWLDAPLSNWNSPGMAIPNAPASTALPEDDPRYPRCFEGRRPPETAEDEAVVRAGWTLFGMSQSGWGLKIIGGLAAYDGMCRPADFNIFVFVDGAFAGTVAPAPMYARSDGVEIDTSVWPPRGTVMASFARYSSTDPFCCPSRTSYVEYRIDRGPSGPVLMPVSVRTVDRPPG